MDLHLKGTPLKRAGEAFANRFNKVCTRNLKKWRRFLLLFRFFFPFAILSFLPFCSQFFKPGRMVLGLVAPPTLTFLIPTPMFLFSGE